jgi:hypothetical protein
MICSLPPCIPCISLDMLIPLVWLVPLAWLPVCTWLAPWPQVLLIWGVDMEALSSILMLVLVPWLVSVGFSNNIFFGLVYW